MQYYSYFLIERGVLDIHNDQVVGFVVDSGCSYFRSISFPDTVHVGLRVAKLGNSSVRYEIALYRNDEQGAANSRDRRAGDSLTGIRRLRV